MSAQQQQTRISVPAIRQSKGPGKVVALTAYTAPMARLLDPHADLLLVGDSLGMVVYGLPSTLGVTLDMMIAHGAAVVRGSTRACVVVDLPFGSYQAAPAQAFEAAARVLAETGAQAVKLEGGAEMADTVQFLAARGVPVVSHIGLMPQQVNSVGGYKAQGMQADGGERIMHDARALEAAGAFALVVECTAEAVGRRVTEALGIPVIGIGASPACDGQILVTEDMLGMSGARVPRFVKQYAQLGAEIEQAAARYAEDVRGGAFPAPEHCFGVRAS
ncbi:MULTISPECIES: 3-methyl-2-oxobutanoate hydroxymethyltransferase [Bordetella]|uniref:3-methyl-2-oxobutanoate hydroxymethyltransferase n=2 Tax=Bordetella TaxID=517 RepID=A0A261V7X9_9BORD|nr:MULTISPECIES: 3-methyl-2-oxobutanoate hydroxymethyltransferase [Bordetella]MDM9558992.1 3-methyl-2-oxobutanoate hydroxymethyltransferase [Bordetella petrii]OZI69712.1 3-methyl-2-oxobutanoate hydroxymethyltransferase [Bordetella genomosp. 2]